MAPQINYLNICKIYYFYPEHRPKKLVNGLQLNMKEMIDVLTHFYYCKFSQEESMKCVGGTNK